MVIIGYFCGIIESINGLISDLQLVFRAITVIVGSWFLVGDNSWLMVNVQDNSWLGELYSINQRVGIYSIIMVNSILFYDKIVIIMVEWIIVGL
jgi:hypothetical protein